MNRLKIIILMVFLGLVIAPSAFNWNTSSKSAGTPVMADADTQSTEADQANVAATTDATYVPGSVDLEGVSASDRTTYSLRTDTDPEAARTDSATSVSRTPSADAGTVTPVEDPGDGRLAPCPTPPATDALTGFDDKTNNFTSQATFDADKGTFEDVDVIADGLGPVYNAQSCKECHQNPVTGAISQINELRAGHNVTLNGQITFKDAPGGSLINDRGIPTKNYNGDPKKSAKVQERVPPLYTAGIIGGGPALTGEEKVRTFRTSLNTLGDGFVEAVADGTLIAIANNQPGTTNNEINGLVITVPVLEAPGQPKRVARFGWKNQHASLLSFSGDAYLNEIGITNFLILAENTSLGRFVGFGSGFDSVPDNTPCTANPGVTCGEDTAEDIRVFARFMRATKAPPRDPDIIAQYNADVIAGSQIFTSMVDPQTGTIYHSCAACHVPSMITAKPCTVINGGTFSVPAALGSKVIRPFGDFLLHDIGTGDFIVQNGGPITRTRVRTAPLWGVRTRDRLMHDGESLTFNEAILRHAGEAMSVTNRYQTLLNATQRRQLITFLESL
ncbi:MAG: hypothetical protein QOF02_1793 [Blastocatellia bacterium]|jgi:CxxC motif-containing protein (DUF1111 family)|nr:hypothetical protein [Blastocatellia bacterium]